MRSIGGSVKRVEGAWLSAAFGLPQSFENAFTCEQTLDQQQHGAAMGYRRLAVQNFDEHELLPACQHAERPINPPEEAKLKERRSSLEFRVVAAE